MKKKVQPLIGEKDRIKKALAEWIFQSHNWIEVDDEFYKCKWCGKHISNFHPVTASDLLCQENPVIKKIRNKCMYV